MQEFIQEKATFNYQALLRVVWDRTHLCQDITKTSRVFYQLISCLLVTH